jgi:hypothetical protein
MPCGKIISPLAKLATRLPSRSNFRTTGRSEPRQEFAPQRSATQIETPSLSMSTALVAPHVRPAGIFAQPSIVRNGFGWAATRAAVAKTSAETREKRRLRWSGIDTSLVGRNLTRLVYNPPVEAHPGLEGLYAPHAP